VDTVVTRCRGREIGEKHVMTEIYDVGDARQRDGYAERMAARRCRGRGKCSQACHGRTWLGGWNFFIWVQRVLHILVGVYVPLFF
jgi:hypothetical protein